MATKRQSAVAVGTVGILIDVVNGLGALQTVGTWVPGKFLPFASLTFYGISLYLLTAAHREDLDSVEHRRASVRARINWKTDDYGKRQPFILLENKGELEARRIHLKPVTDSEYAYPWQMEIEEIGSLFKSDQARDTRLKRTDRPAITCELCAGPPQNLRELLLELPRHRAHEIKRIESSKPEDLQYFVNAAAGMMDVTLPFVVTYFDEFERSITASHRLIILVRDGEPDGRIEFESQSEPSRR